jgi:cupin 2 domain-containing protein
MHPPVKNLFADMPDPAGGEQSLILTQTGQVRIERIVSYGQASPPGFWYDQPTDEWVVLLQGTATLQFTGPASVTLKSGDHTLIPRHVRHRVEAASADAVWLAVHGWSPTPT